MDSVFTPNELLHMESMDVDKIAEKINEFIIKLDSGNFEYYKRAGRTIFKWKNPSRYSLSDFNKFFLQKILKLMGKKDYFLSEVNNEITFIFR